ncbi:MAG: hypothetical protein JWM62_1000 [Frankiales bacterium]|nr:hypothetical protein [Frankiales bacterium]
MRWPAPFAPRADRVLPGHLLALAAGRCSRSHGTPRAWRPPERAYASAGLPGAQWWVTGPDPQQVELDDVRAFSDAHGLWDRLV